MKPFKMREILTRGLRRESDESAEQGLKDLYNKKPSRRGLISIETPVNPITLTGDTQSFPLPLMISGANDYYYLAYVSGLPAFHKVTPGSPWTVGSDLTSSGALPSVDGAGTSKVFTKTTEYTHASYNDMFYISSGDAYITNIPVYAELGGSYVNWACGRYQDTPVPRAICFDDGRLIMGGFKGGSGWWSGNGANFWSVWNKHAPSDITTKPGATPDDGCIIWGMPAGGESSLHYTVEQCLISGVKLTDIKEIVLDILREWSVGFSFIPWDGGVLNIKKLGADLIVYGDQGIGIMRQGQNGRYRLQQVLDVGLANCAAVAGGMDRHLFLDAKGYLWGVESGPKFEKIGYIEFLASYLGYVPVMSFDANRGDFYLSINTDGFIFTADGGAAKTRHRLQSAVCYGDDLLGTFASGSSGWYFETGQIDMDSRAVKTCETVELGKETLSGATAILYFRAKAGSFLYTSAESFSNAGIIDFVQSGIDFRVKVAGTEDSEPIPYANINFRDDNVKRGLGGYV